jgi:Ser/Thr protein kinase RdoA (MazF antagonist)
LADLAHTFKNKRGNIHDTPKHVAKLRSVLASHTSHERYGEVAPTCKRILQQLDTLPALAGLPRRVVHGDPKISNVLFDKAGRALCLVDLDTLGPANVAVELGDALRSWCNPREEDDDASSIDLGFFEAAVQGYLRGAASFITPDETAMLAIGVETIALELAARFAADALEETYFGWDRTRFSRASEHNLARAVGQLAVAESMHAQRHAATRLLK